MNTLNRMSNSIALLLITFMFFCSPLFAGTVQQIKNGKVLLSLEGTPAQAGDQFFTVDENNKKNALIQITAVKADRAVGKIIKGTPLQNNTILAKGANRVAAAPKEATFIRHDLTKLSFNLEYSMDLISTLQQDDTNPTPQKETVDMKGSNIGLNVALGFPLGKNFSVQGFAGYEMLKVTGTALRLVCEGKTTRDCNANISYLTVGALARFNYAADHFEFWVGSGVGFKQPLSKNSTALTLENISLGNTLIVALGVDYHLSNTKFIPVSFEYHKSFNESETVPIISHMGLQVGFGILY